MASSSFSQHLLAGLKQHFSRPEQHLGDECFLFAHIVDCVRALVELQGQKEKETEKEATGGVLCTGFVSHIERVVKEALLPANSIFSSSSEGDGDRSVVVSHSLAALPALTLQETANKKLPLLHYAAYNGQSLDMVKAVYKSNTSNIRSCDKTGALPLHWAILNKESPDIAQYILDEYPEAASLPDSAGYLPLHWAVNNDSVNMTIVKSLLERYPMAARTPSSKNKTLPLHWCVNRSEPNLALVKELLASHPEAVSTPCDHGWLPLHYCVNRAKVSLTILRLLLDKHPSGVSHRNSDGQMPIHRLLDRYEPNRKAVKWLIEAEPATLKACDSEGYLPLHVALDGSKPPSWRLIKLLLQSAPQTVEITTLDGFLPLHIAMKMQDRFGNPSDASVSSGNNQIEDDNKDNTSADGQSALEKEAALKLNQNRYLSIVQELVSLYPEAVHIAAVDIVPVKEGVNPDTWEGQWRKSRWTPYSRAIGKGKQTPIAKLLRPYKKKSDRDLSGGMGDKRALSKPDLLISPSRSSNLIPGGSSSKFESSPVVTPHKNQTPVEVQLHNKLHDSGTKTSNNDVPSDMQSPSVSNNVNSANYGNMNDVQLPPLQSSPRRDNNSNGSSTLFGASALKSPRRSPRYNPPEDDLAGYTSTSQQIIEKSQHGDLYNSLNSLRPDSRSTRRDSSASESAKFWAAKKVDVTEGPTTFTIDNDASVKEWKWQW